MRAQVASLVLLALFVSAQAGSIQITKAGVSIPDILVAKAAGKGITITKATDAPGGRAAAQPAQATAVAAAKTVDAPKVDVKVEKKVEAVAPPQAKEEVKAAAPAPAPKAEPKKEEPKAAAAPAPKKEEPKKAEAQATVVAAKPAEAPKQAAAAAVAEKKVDVQVATPLVAVTKDVQVAQVAPTKSATISAGAGKGGVQKSLIVNAGRKLQGGKGGSVSVVVGGDSNSGRAAAVGPSKVNGGASFSKSISKSFSLPTISISKVAEAATTQAVSASKIVSVPTVSKSASFSFGKGRKLQGGKGGSVSVVVGGDSNSGRAAAAAPSKVNGGASFSKSISKSFSLPTISISKVADGVPTQTFSASKVLAAPQVTKSASLSLGGKGRKLQGGKGGSVSVVVGGNSGRAIAPAPRQPAPTTGKGFSASKVIAFPQITLPSFTKTFTVGKSGK